MNSNLPIIYKTFLGDKFRMRNKKVGRTLKKPIIFQTLVGFLDNETVFEIRYVCKSFVKIISEIAELDYRFVKIIIGRVQEKKKREREMRDLIFANSFKTLKLDDRKSMINCFKFENKGLGADEKDKKLEYKTQSLTPGINENIKIALKNNYKIPGEDKDVLDEILGVESKEKLNKLKKNSIMSKFDSKKVKDIVGRIERMIAHPQGSFKTNIEQYHMIVNVTKKTGNAIYQGYKKVREIDDQIIDYLIMKGIL